MEGSHLREIPILCARAGAGSVGRNGTTNRTRMTPMTLRYVGLLFGALETHKVVHRLFHTINQIACAAVKIRPCNCEAS